MEDTDTLGIPLERPSSNKVNAFQDATSASGSGVKPDVLNPHGESLCTDQGTVCDYTSNRSDSLFQSTNMKGDHDSYEADDDDEGLYLAINSIPVKVELEEEDLSCDAGRQDGYTYEDALSSSFIHEEGLASASWYNTNYLMDEVNLEEISSALPEHQKRLLERGYLLDNDECDDSERLARRRLMAKERAKKYRNSLTSEQLQALREKDRERTKRRRMMMSEDECLLVRIKNRENAQMRRMDARGSRYKKRSDCLDSDEEKALLIREKNRERMRLKRLNMTEEEKIIERQKNRERVRKRRQIQKAEALLKKLVNAHNDMLMKQNTTVDTNSFMQNLMDVNTHSSTGPSIGEQLN
ncbi:zinc finger protein 821-like isoform X2 [Palaemon carinicauda]|uniref:zinc finger protein 821-like isoform X2 n=1 Tax=Palaemon carinicauda TaxID=392227 RepID=UPI0035B65671